MNWHSLSEIKRAVCNFIELDKTHVMVDTPVMVDGNIMELNEFYILDGFTTFHYISGNDLISCYNYAGKYADLCVCIRDGRFTPYCGIINPIIEKILKHAYYTSDNDQLTYDDLSRVTGLLHRHLDAINAMNDEIDCMLMTKVKSARN